MTEFEGVKDDVVRQKWNATAREALAFGVWQRTGIPLSESDILVSLHQRYPRGVPQGEITFEDVVGVRQRLGASSEPRLHPVDAETVRKWCACNDLQHAGESAEPSPILVHLERLIRHSGYAISGQG